MILTTASQMREMDRRTIEELGIPGLVLMENAARGVVQVINRLYPEIRSVAVLAGKGNNGGDGLAVARCLHLQGLAVVVYLAGAETALKGEAAANLALALGCGVPVLEIPEQAGPSWMKEQWSDTDLLVDALLGTGLEKEVSGLYRELITVLNSLPTPKVAVDIPSGLSADTGQPLGVCVEAAVSVTFGLPKRGQLLFPGSRFVGRLLVADIGIPAVFYPAPEDRVELLAGDDLALWLPPRPPDGHKGTFGHALILAGSTGKTGAAALTAAGALRVGAGLVTVGLPSSLNPILEVKLTEAMTEPLTEGEPGCLGLPALPRLREILEGKKALALGPGISTAPGPQALVRALLKEKISIPLVIDADGLNALAGDPETLAALAGRAILTPHPGEMSRLTGKSVQEIQRDRIGTAREFAREYGVVLVLKGARTVIAEPAGGVFLNPTAHPVLGSGGMGDVLTGMIAGWLAQGAGLLPAAALGVFQHGAAGQRLADARGGGGILASEVADSLPELIAHPENWPATVENFLPLIKEVRV
ncbi:MAG: NAD(P)H-hydrate dehydratase [Desulfobacterota bacterium]|nr:NAD(P)H-hydrate dehydratase [Thermodesulfobacteriota bacterium]